MQYRDGLQRIAEHVTFSLGAAFPGHPVLGVINGKAGTVARHHALQRVAESLARSPVSLGEGADPADITTVWTDSVDALHEVMSGWLRRVGEKKKSPTPIIASFGGDGTHNQVMRSIPEPRTGAGPDVWFFRVPLGSGNDAVGAATLPEVLGSLSEPLAPVWIPEVEVETPRRTLGAFNIASVGIDAYVTMMHHHLRNALPGNTYRIIANLALLIYERLVNLGPLSINAGGEDLGRGKRVLIAFGVHGNLTYGDHIRILPGEENLCVFESVSLLEKIRMKKLLMKGAHVHQPITTMRSAREILIEYDRKLPVQVDGEAEWLAAEDFPLTMRVRDNARMVLQAERENGSRSGA